MRYSTPIRIIAMILVVVLTWNSVSVGAVSAAMMNQEFGVGTAAPNSNETSSGADSSDAATESEAAQTLPVYEDGTILLYTYEQLQLVATGVVLRSQGAPVLAEDGVAVTYSPDASYRIAQDIALPAGMLWQVPGFLTGRIEPAQNAAERPLYDAETDTIYIYNPYQLAVMAMDDAAQQPVMSNDADAATVGMGKLTILDDGSFLTYSPEHNYVISSQFDSALPEKSYATVNQNELQTAAPMAEGETATESVTEPVTEPEVTEPEIEAQAEVGLGGQEFAGQVLKTVDGVQYIMLGTEKQLHAIGVGSEVYTAVYQVKYDAGDVKYYLENDSSGISPLAKSITKFTRKAPYFFSFIVSLLSLRCPAFLRCVPGQQWLHDLVVGQICFIRHLHQLGQVAVRIQAVLNSGLDQAGHDCAAGSPPSAYWKIGNSSD